MRLVYILILFVSTTQCTTYSFQITDKEFNKYVTKFKNEAQFRGLNFDSYLEDTKIIFDTKGITKTEDVYALCYNSYLVILVNKEDWDMFDEQQREMLIFHELGHCVLGRPHYNKLTEIKIPTSLMTEDYIPSSIYDKYRDSYLDELFGLTY